MEQIISEYTLIENQLKREILSIEKSSESHTQLLSKVELTQKDALFKKEALAKKFLQYFGICRISQEIQRNIYNISVTKNFIDQILVFWGFIRNHNWETLTAPLEIWNGCLLYNQVQLYTRHAETALLIFCSILSRKSRRHWKIPNEKDIVTYFYWLRGREYFSLNHLGIKYLSKIDLRGVNWADISFEGMPFVDVLGIEKVYKNGAIDYLSIDGIVKTATPDFKLYETEDKFLASYDGSLYS